MPDPPEPRAPRGPPKRRTTAPAGRRRALAAGTAALAGLLLLVQLAGGEAGAPPAPAAEEQGTLPRLDVHFFDVGQGDATLLSTDAVNVLVDTGRHDRDDVPGHLVRAGVEALDVVIVTHPHADHLGQFDHVMEAFDVAEVWWAGAAHTTRTFERALDALEASAAVYAEPRAGDVTAVGDLTFEFVNPPIDADPADLHDSGLAFRVSFGELRILFTGDAEAATEGRMVERTGALLAADVYHVGHHGSSTSSTAELVAAVSPAVAVYSAGRDNPYGHPGAGVVERLESAGAAVYGTATHGTVVLTTDGETHTLATEVDR